MSKKELERIAVKEFRERPDFVPSLSKNRGQIKIRSKENTNTPPRQNVRIIFLYQGVVFLSIHTYGNKVKLEGKWKYRFQRKKAGKDCCESVSRNATKCTIS